MTLSASITSTAVWQTTSVFMQDILKPYTSSQKSTIFSCKWVSVNPASQMEHLSGYTASQASYVILLQPSPVRYGTPVWVHCKPGKVRYLSAAITCQIWHSCRGTLQAKQAMLSYTCHHLSDRDSWQWRCYPAQTQVHIVTLKKSSLMPDAQFFGKLCLIQQIL